MLAPQARTQLDGIVQQMIQSGKSDADIKAVINDFKANHATDYLKENPSLPTNQPVVGQPTGIPGFGGGVPQEKDIASQQMYSPSMPYNSSGGGAFQSTGLKTLTNVPSSAWNAIKNIGSTVKNFVQYGNPIATGLNIGQDKNPVAQIGKVLGGAGVQAGEALGIVPKGTPTPEFAQAVDYLGSRYGSWENFKRTATNDPVGVAMDLAAVLTGGAGLLGKSEELANAASKVAELPKAGMSKLTGGIGLSQDEQIAKALGTTGKQTVAQTLNRPEVAADALKTITERGGMVTDKAGVEVPFNPAKATYNETLQAWKNARDSIYQEYTDLAKQAGDSGIRITQTDFASLFNKLNDIIKNETSPFASKAEQIKGDLTRIFSDKRYNGLTMKEIQPTDFQRFLENLNNDVKADPRAASAKVAGQISQEIRNIMDSKITQATGEAYQALRTKYANLKAIETNLVNQTKKAAIKANPGIAPYIEGYGGIDVLLGALFHSPFEAVRGVGMVALGELMKKLRNPESALQKSFQGIMKEKVVAPKQINVAPVLPPISPLQRNTTSTINVKKP